MATRIREPWKVGGCQHNGQGWVSGIVGVEVVVNTVQGAWWDGWLQRMANGGLGKERQGHEGFKQWRWDRVVGGFNWGRGDGEF